MGEIFVGIDGTTPHKSKAVHFSNPDDLKMSFIGALFQGSRPARENKHWFAGPDLLGFRVPECVGVPLEFITKARKRLGSGSHCLTIAGYSRGAYAAVRVAQALGKAGMHVDNLILLDTVKVTDQGVEQAVGQVIDRYDNSFDTETRAREIVLKSGRRDLVSARQIAAAEYGRRVEYEIYERDQSARFNGSWNAVDDIGSFLIPPNVKNLFSYQRDPKVKSRDWTMGVAPVKVNVRGSAQPASIMFATTHAGMGGMPFTGDIPTRATTRVNEWQESRRLAQYLSRTTTALDAFQYFKHPLLNDANPPAWWLDLPAIRTSYYNYYTSYGSDGLTLKMDAEFARDKIEQEVYRGPRQSPI